MELHEHFDEIHPKVLDFLNDHEEKIIEGYEENDGHPFQHVFNSFLNLFNLGAGSADSPRQKFKL